MKVLIFPDRERTIARAAEFVLDQVRSRPSSVLGLATGSTMEALYDWLVAEAPRRGVSFYGVSTFNLDEYLGLPPKHPASYHTYMRQRFFDRTDISPDRAHLPRGDCADAAEEAGAYEAAISEAGGIDLQLLGIGRNGHIGFNEPTSSLASRTRVKTLAQSTLRANSAFFDPGETMPKFALTMGIGTILDARGCLLVATGAEKADAVAQAIEGPLGAVCPASALQLHPRATLVLDSEAAAGLKLRDYYEQVHPGGEEVYA